jgi:hypothetical protein
LESEAYQAIQREAERSDVLDSAKSEPLFIKRSGQWEQADEAMEKHIERSET